MSAVYRFDGTLIHNIAHHNWTVEGIKALSRVYPRSPSRDTQIAAAILDRKVVHVPDSEAPGIPEPSPIIARALGYRSLLAVPMLKDGNSVGAIAVVRLGGAGPFSEAQIELVKTFADQAVIAIENARLFQAEQVSKRELIEALEQQTATADVLKAISRSALDVQKVFDALVESAARLCDANDAAIFQVFGDGLRLMAHYGQFRHPDMSAPVGQLTISPVRGAIMGRVVLDRRTIHVADVLA